MARRSVAHRSSRVFADTAGWLALFNRSDQLHDRAVAARRDLYRNKVLLVTTEFVLIEVADALAAPRFRASTVALLRGLRTEPSLEIIPATSDLIEKGLALYGQRLDKEWGLTDCISFVVMAQRAISDAFTSDHHFEQAGFRILL